MGVDQDTAIKLLKGGMDGSKEWNSRRANGESVPALQGFDLTSAVLHNVNFDHVKFTDVRFQSGTLGGLTFAHATLHECQFFNCSLLALLPRCFWAVTVLRLNEPTWMVLDLIIALFLTHHSKVPASKEA